MGLEPLHRRKEGSPTFTIWLGALIWFPVLWVLISTYTLPVLSSLRTWNWQETSCTIHSARTQRSETSVRHSKIATNRAVVRYGYEVAGREYISERYNPNDGVVDGVSERVAKLAQGVRVVCYYDPDEPSQAILDREGVVDPIWAFLIQMHLYLGLNFFLDGLKGLEKKKPRPYLRTEGLVIGFSAWVARCLVGGLAGVVVCAVSVEALAQSGGSGGAPVAEGCPLTAADTGKEIERTFTSSSGRSIRFRLALPAGATLATRRGVFVNFSRQQPRSRRHVLSKPL